jgi:hypothetical protein
MTNNSSHSERLAVIANVRKWAFSARPLFGPLAAGRLSGILIAPAPPERQKVVESGTAALQ